MPHSDDSLLLSRLKVGSDSAAAQALWRRYFNRLAALARARLQRRTRRVADEEDVALSAFDSFFRGVAEGRFPRLDDRDDLWQVLVLLTERKAIDRIRRESAQKRGGGLVRGDSLFADASDSGTPGLDGVPGPEPSPEFAVQFADECDHLIQSLGDAELIRVALLKLEGFSSEEIADRISRTARSVQRKLESIRRIWEAEFRDG